jgi:hypothetical protein
MLTTGLSYSQITGELAKVPWYLRGAKRIGTEDDPDQTNIGVYAQLS